MVDEENAISFEVKCYRQLYASRHVDRYTITCSDGRIMSFNDCGISGVGSQTIILAREFLGGYSLEGWSFQCVGPGYGFARIKKRTQATGYANQIRLAFPSMPERSIIETACRMEDTGNNSFEAAVHAHARHTQTNYDSLCHKTTRDEARASVKDKVLSVLENWRSLKK